MSAPGAAPSGTGVLLVSHSAGLAAGLLELAAQMAPEAVLEAAGGMPDGSLGNSYDVVLAAAQRALGRAGGLVVLTDLGSATMIAETVAEELTAQGSHVVVVEAPFVEGAVAAAVAAHQGADLETVAQVARQAAAAFIELTPSRPGTEPGDDAGPPQTRTLVLHNDLGLHARAAAMLARVVGGYDARVEVNGAEGTSVLALMSLGLVQGDVLDVRATGAQAEHVLDAVGDIVADRFGEE